MPAAKKSSDALRQQLLELLRGGNAHAGFDAAVADFPAPLRAKKPKGAEHSAWQLLEHMRIAQWDILEFTRNPKHVSPKFPEGYWPKSPDPPDKQAWNKSRQAFQADLQAMLKLVQNKSTDLLAPLPHGDGQ